MDTDTDIELDVLIEDICGCGYPIVFTPEGWQHDAAPWYWGDDHDAQTEDQEVLGAASAWLEAYERSLED